MHLRHLGLPVRDSRRSIRFYARYFGFDPGTAQPYPDGTVIVRNPDRFDLALHQVPDVVVHESSAFLHFGFALPDPDAVRTLRERLMHDGVSVIETDDEPDLVSFKCLDPDGWHVEVYWEEPSSTSRPTGPSRSSVRPPMSEPDDFLGQTVARHSAAATRVRNGDPAPFVAQLSTHDPVTLFPASQPSQVGWSDVSGAIRRVASVYSGSDSVEFEVVAAGASGDLAYLVGYERAASSVGGGAAEDLRLRVTQVYRREAGEWRLVHRHADPGPGGSTGAAELRRAMRERLHEDPEG
jgi:ketosteroid isomerase-like protein